MLTVNKLRVSWTARLRSGQTRWLLELTVHLLLTLRKKIISEFWFSGICVIFIRVCSCCLFWFEFKKFWHFNWRQSKAPAGFWHGGWRRQHHLLDISHYFATNQNKTWNLINLMIKNKQPTQKFILQCKNWDLSVVFKLTCFSKWRIWSVGIDRPVRLDRGTVTDIGNSSNKSTKY